MSERLYHLCPAETWQSCKSKDDPYFPPSYSQDGFIHLTADPSLLLTVANHFYKGDAGKWIVLVIDSGALKAEVKFEPAAPVGNRPSHGLTGPDAADEPLFPHLYGTIDFDAVVAELEVERADDGEFLSIAGL